MRDVTGTWTVRAGMDHVAIMTLTLENGTAIEDREGASAGTYTLVDDRLTVDLAPRTGEGALVVHVQIVARWQGEALSGTLNTRFDGQGTTLLFGSADEAGEDVMSEVVLLERRIAAND